MIHVVMLITSRFGFFIQIFKRQSSSFKIYDQTKQKEQVKKEMDYQVSQVKLIGIIDLYK